MDFDDPEDDNLDEIKIAKLGILDQRQFVFAPKSQLVDFKCVPVESASLFHKLLVKFGWFFSFFFQKKTIHQPAKLQEAMSDCELRLNKQLLEKATHAMAVETQILNVAVTYFDRKKVTVCIIYI